MSPSISSEGKEEVLFYTVNFLSKSRYHEKFDSLADVIA